MNKIKTFFMLSEEDKKQCSRKYFNITPDICICENFIVTLKSDGTVFVSGDKQFDIQDWINVIKICSGKNHVVGLKSDGTVVALGDNTYHQCDVSAWRDIVGISAKDNLTVGISSENITYTTGSFEKTDVEANNEKTMHEIFNLENKLRSMQNSMDTLQNSMITFSARQTNSEASITNTGKQVYKTIGTIVQEYEAKIADLKSQLDSMRDTVGKLLSNQNEIDSNITNVQGKIDNLENTIKQSEQGMVYRSRNFEYFINNNTATLIKYLSSNSLECGVWIPREINGKLVKKISKEIHNSICYYSYIHIPDGVVQIGDMDDCLDDSAEVLLFSKCEYLKDIDVDKNNQHYSSNDGVLFDKNETKLIFYPVGKFDTDYKIPDKVVAIQDDAFGNNLYKNKNLKYLDIPSNVEYIGQGHKGFANNCQNLQAINVSNDNPFFSSIDGILFDKSKNVLIRCPVGKNGYYVVPDTVTEMAYDAFSNCIYIKGILIPDSVKEISFMAFDGHSDDLVVWGNTGSYACEYAKQNNLKFMDKNKNRFLFNRYFGGDK